jgi:hypothetical protein
MFRALTASQIRQEAYQIREKWLRARLPYGIWKCADGREVLFNRNYKPMWERSLAQSWDAKRANPDEWVSFVDQQWFFNDGNPPWDNAKSRARCENVLLEWGVSGFGLLLQNAEGVPLDFYG